MPRSCWPYLMIALLWSSMAATLPAADHFWATLQDQTLEIVAADLIANDDGALSLGVNDPYITIEEDPINLPLERTDDGFRYTPEPNFYGLDSFRYSWISPSGLTIEGVVELLVVPWYVPFAGPMGLLQEDAALPNEQEDGVGYYNSNSGTFYFCSPEPPSPDEVLPCTRYRYPDFEPGWLPLIGTWQDLDGRPLPNRPGLYDPNKRQVYLLDEDLSPECSTCDDPAPVLPLRVLRQFGVSEKPTAMIPIAVNQDGSDFDSVIFFRPRERRFDVPKWSHVEVPLDDSTLWPLTVPGRHGADDLTVFGQQSGDLYVLPQHSFTTLWPDLAGLATARRAGSRAIYEVYEPISHGLTATEPQWHWVNGVCLIDGTQLLQFPSDPDPPPPIAETPCS